MERRLSRQDKRLLIGRGTDGAAMKTGYNGFGDAECVIVDDEPMMSLFDGSRVRPEADNVVSLR